MNDPILIVGAGPTGLTAALELARAGLAVRLIDRLAEPQATSRAIGIQARTLELFQERGLAADMIRLGNTAQGVSVYGGGDRVFRIDFSRVESRFNFILLLAQAQTERLLSEAVGRLGVSIERGVDLVAIAQNSLAHTPVTAVLRHPDGRLELAQTPWLIDAEGAHSIARATLDLPFEGKSLPDQFALGDLNLDGPLEEHDAHIFSSTHGLMAIFPLGNHRFRLIVSNPLGDPHRGQPPTLGEFQSVYDQRSHIPARLRDMNWSSWFRINSRMVSRLRVGHILLGGDSAHIHSPAGGQGMNTGIQDMINLGWKLALVVKGQAPEALLDTYEQERIPIMREVLAETERLTGLIGSENPVVRGLVTHLGPYIGGAGFIQEIGAARMSQIAINYRGGPLAHGHAPGAGLHAGDRVPDLDIRHRADGPWQPATLYDVLDPLRFVLLVATTDVAAEPDRDLEAAAAWGDDLLRLVEIAPPADATNAANAPYESAFGRHPAAFLVRPDGYLALAATPHAMAKLLPEFKQQWLSPA